MNEEANSEEDSLVAFALSKLSAEADKPCQTFVVLTGGEKREILYPELYGPFESYRAAYRWVAELRNAIIAGPESHWPGSIYLEPIDGGYMGFGIINEDTASNPQDCYFAGEEE